MISNLKTKKVILFFLFLVCFFLTHTVGFAKPVTVDTAMQVAANWMLQQTGIEHQALEDSIILFEDGAQDRITPYYIFNMDPGGWVIVSGDDIAYPIIGYAVQGTVDMEDVPPAFSEWMALIEEQITEAVKNDLEPLAETETAWENLDVTDYEVHDVSYGAIPPLIQTTWSQGKYYNTSCPADSAGPDGHVYVGCVATAAGQIMKYHNWPVTGTGSHSYYHSTYGTLSANFGATTYNWGSMPASGQVTSYNTAVATLLYHVGVSVNMNYGTGGSGASSADVPSALRTYFKYNADNLVKRSSYSTSAWLSKIKADHNAGRPVYYRGQGSGGHAFVCDGYTGTNYFHFNWGWNGSSDGYFYLNDLTPGSHNYNYSQGAIFGIEPEGGGDTPEITSPVEGSTLSCDSQTFQWTDNDTPVTEWWLYLGPSQGTNDYYDSGSLGTSTSHTVTRCWPDDSSTVWARLWYKTGGSWEYEDFQYIAPTNCPGPSPPEITSPTPDSTLSCESQAFQWTDNDTPVTEWWLYLGSSQGTNDYYDSGSLGTSTSDIVARCWPDDSSTVWARLWYKTGGSWESKDFQYIAPTGCPGPSPPEITSPAQDSILSCESQAFQWTDNDTPVTEWWLYLGTSQGANDYYDSGSLGTSTSDIVARCWPDDSSTVWARLWYKTGGSWESEDFQYTAPTNCPGPSPPEITSPTPGSTLSCNSDTFQWTDNGTPVTEWWLYLGSSQGAYNYYNSGSLGTSTSHTVTRCWPDNGSTIWARLWYKTGGSWEFEDFQYIAPTGCTAGGFNSQFNDDDSGWEVHYGTWWIASSQWYTTYGNPNYWSSVSYAADFTNFDYQARLWRSGCDSCANSILIRGTPNPLTSSKRWHSYYVFQYTRNGSYSVWKGIAGGTGTSLQDWTYSSAINQGNAWNTLRVVANGTSLYFYINGTLVWSGSDSSLSSGRVGIRMYSDGTGGDQLWVDWATLTEGAFTITDKVSEEQKALNEEANERGGGSKETSVMSSL